MWHVLRDRVLSPTQVWIPSALLAGSAVLLIVGGHPLLVLLALAVQGIYAATGKKGLFLLGASAVVLASFYLLDKTVWNLGWAFTLLISLWVGYEMIGEVQGITSERDLSYKELEKGVDLWKTRFETLRDKIASDKEVWEGELGKLEEIIAEKKDEADSLRVLIQVSHKETKRAEEALLQKQESGASREELEAWKLRYQNQEEVLYREIAQVEALQKQCMSQEKTLKEVLEKKDDPVYLEELNDIRCKYHELELLYDSESEKVRKLVDKNGELEVLLASQQEALKQRQQINESLHTKPTAKPVISLRDLAKKR